MQAMLKKRATVNLRGAGIEKEEQCTSSTTFYTGVPGTLI